MKPFAYERAGATAEAIELHTARAAYLGGGTNLVDLMRLGVADPDVLVDVTKLGHDRIEPTADGGLIRRGGDQLGSRRLPGRARALPGALRKRCSPARPTSCATSPRPAATCSSAPVAHTSRTSRSRATSGTPALAARRARAITATWRSSGIPRRASPPTRPTWPSP